MLRLYYFYINFDNISILCCQNQLHVRIARFNIELKQNYYRRYLQNEKEIYVLRLRICVN